MSPIEHHNHIRLLIVEDLHAETQVLVQELEDAEFLFEHKVASTEKEFSTLLKKWSPNVILSPYSLKNTNAVKLLGLARAQHIDAPFILLAYDLSEDIAIDLLGQGIEDYVLRSSVKRLPVAIKKALQRHKIQLDLKRGEVRLKNSEAAMRNMVKNAPIAVAMFDQNMNYLVVSDFWLKHENKKEEELIGNNHYDVVPEIPDSWKKVHQSVLSGKTHGSESEKMIRADGNIEIIRWKMNPWFDVEGEVGGAALFIEDITEKIRTKKHLEKAARSLAIAQSVAKIGSWVLDHLTKKVQWSAEMFVIHGMEKQDVELGQIREMMHPDDVHLFDSTMDQLMEGEETNIVYRISTPAGNERVMRGRGRISKDQDGSITEIYGTVQDITEQYTLTQALGKSEQMFKELAENIEQVFWVTDSTGSDLLYMSPLFEKVYGTPLEAIYKDGDAWISNIHPEDKERVFKSFRKNGKLGLYNEKYRIVHSKKKIRWVHARAFPIKDERGKVVRLVGLTQDITESRQMELDLVNNEQLLRDMAENINEVFWLTDWENNKVLYISPRYETLYGQTIISLLLDPGSWSNPVHPDDVKRIKKKFKQAHTGEYDEEYRLVMKDGSIKWVRDRAFPIRNEDGKVTRIAGITEEITERKKVDEQVETLSLVAKETVNGVLIHNPDGTILWANRGFTDITGYHSDELIGKEPWALLSNQTADQRSIEKIYSRINKGESYAVENQFKRKDKETVWISITFTPVLGDGGKVVKIVSVGTDVTKHKALEALQTNMIQQMDARVKERTTQLEKANKELQSEVWENQRISDELYHNNLDLNDSIQYAKRIQNSILPSVEAMRQSFDDLFVLYVPKDVVSGDFYWYHRKNHLIYTAIIDCTGHGVPGALMSMIANQLLNQTVIQKRLKDPGKILTHLNKLMVKTLNQKEDGQAMRDGMDLSLCVVDHKTNQLSFSGAFNNLYHMCDGKIEVHPGTRHSIGGHHETIEKEFETVTFKIKQGDIIYMSTDGYIDQFGGPKGKKLMKKRFLEILEKGSKFSMKKQQQLLQKKMVDWRGDLPQVDDILVAGFKY